ncbi:MAG TPA: V-type ATP synthase subunit K [Acholeplasma sp.]|nr:V-type ATP synthase subunit K [Acholeplasma sp.]
MDGNTLTLLGVVLATALSGIGTAIAVSISTRAAAGVLTEKPNLFGKLLVLVALTTTNGIYGFLVSVLIMSQSGLLGGSNAVISQAEGMKYLMASLPIGIVGLLAAVYQAKSAATSIYMTAKKEDLSARGIVMVSLIETYPILALLVSVLILLG